VKKLSPKEHYQHLRKRSCEELWTEDVPAFDRTEGADRVAQVGIIRAVGVVFSETGTPAQREQARQWLRPLLRDPAEKVRRYAMAALPKLGADEQEEAELLALLERPASGREKAFLGRTLEKIGGAATVDTLADAGLHRTAQKAAANFARRETPGAVRLDAPLEDIRDVRIHLHIRSGLERILEDELHEKAANFRPLGATRGLVAIAPIRSFTLADIHALRTFSTASLALGTVPRRGAAPPVDALAAIIASPLARRMFAAFTEGPIRYRLEFVSKGHQRSAVRALGNRVYELAPRLLNDSRDALWQVDIHEIPAGWSVELTPRLRPDPRFAYRRRDVPAASHPPLAACMARLAGPGARDVVWDPFCGSGLELIERGLRGGVARFIGTDLSTEAIAITRENLASAGLDGIPATLAAADFRDHTTIEALRPGAVSLILTNPPLGRRVPIPNLAELIGDLFAAAESVLAPGGRLVFVNPLSVKPVGRGLRAEFRERIDLGGFHCHLEKYVKAR
jgi:23S rRNA G2445 N2-methylase RlmL